MKEINELGSKIKDAIANAVKYANPEGLETMHIHYNYIENYLATIPSSGGGQQERTNDLHLIIEPPSKWPVSLRSGLGLDEADCGTEIEVNMYVLQRGNADDEFYRIYDDDIAQQGSVYRYYYIHRLSSIDTCMLALQKVFEAIHNYASELSVSVDDDMVDVIVPGVSSKNDAGIMKRVTLKWYE